MTIYVLSEQIYKFPLWKSSHLSYDIVYNSGHSISRPSIVPTIHPLPTTINLSLITCMTTISTMLPFDVAFFARIPMITNQVVTFSLKKERKKKTPGTQSWKRGYKCSYKDSNCGTLQHMFIVISRGYFQQQQLNVENGYIDRRTDRQTDKCIVGQTNVYYGLA